MAARASRSLTRDVDRLHPQPVVLETSKVVACLVDRPPKRCPYDLGANCALIEIGKGIVMKRKMRSDAVGAFCAGVISALAVWLVYF